MAALGMLVTDLLAGALFLIAAAVVLPPVNAWLLKTFKLALSAKVKAWVVLGLLVWGSIAGASGVTRKDQREAAEAAAATREAARVDFASNSGTILRRMDSALTARNHNLAVSIGQRYSGVATDSQFLRLYRTAQAAQKREADRAKERDLLARAAATPAGNMEANRDLYRQLAAVNPSNASYKAKYDDYVKRIGQRDAAEQDRVRRFGRPPQPSAWDGTYREVKDYLQQVANDPERLKMDGCTAVYHVERGWLVGCDYRGANAFGGIIRQSNWFIIRQGRVVEMLPSSAYRP